MELLGKAIAWNYWIFVPTSPHLLKYSHYCDNLARSPMDLISAILLPGYWQYFTEKNEIKGFFHPFIVNLFFLIYTYIRLSGKVLFGKIWEYESISFQYCILHWNQSFYLYSANQLTHFYMEKQYWAKRSQPA